MRDIRQDLRERLKEVPGQRLQLDQLENTLKALLQHEEMRYASQGGETLSLAVPSSGQLSDVIMAALKVRPMTSEDLKNYTVPSYDFGTSAPGRVLNFTLQAMEKRGEIEKCGEGWRIKSPVPTFGSAWESLVSEQKN